MEKKSETSKESGFGSLLVVIIIIAIVIWIVSSIFAKDWVVIRNYGSAPDTAIIQDGDAGEKFRSAEDCMAKATYLKQMSQDDAWFICGRKCRQEGIIVICEEFKR